MRSKNQIIARELSRMHPADRAMSKAVYKAPHDGSFNTLYAMIAKAFIDSHAANVRHNRRTGRG